MTLCCHGVWCCGTKVMKVALLWRPSCRRCFWQWTTYISLFLGWLRTLRRTYLSSFLVWRLCSRCYQKKLRLCKYWRWFLAFTAFSRITLFSLSFSNNGSGYSFWRRFFLKIDPDVIFSNLCIVDICHWFRPILMVYCFIDEQLCLLLNRRSMENQ